MCSQISPEGDRSQSDTGALGGHQQRATCSNQTFEVDSVQDRGRCSTASKDTEVLDVVQDIPKRVQDWTCATDHTLRHFPCTLHVTGTERRVCGAPQGRPHERHRLCGKFGQVHVWNSRRSNLWQKDDTSLLKSHGYAEGDKLDARLRMRGEDLVLLEDVAAVKNLHELLNTKYTVKLEANIGDGEQGMQTVGRQWNSNLTSDM